MIFTTIAVALAGFTIATRLLIVGWQQLKNERYTHDRPNLREQLEKELALSLAQSQADNRMNRETVRQIAERDFPNHNPVEIMAILNQYGQTSTEFGRARVQLAILSLSNGDVNKLHSYVQLANIDFRDVLLMAETPRPPGNQPPSANRPGPTEITPPWAVNPWWENRNIHRLLAFFIVIMIILVWLLYNS